LQLGCNITSNGARLIANFIKKGINLSELRLGCAFIYFIYLLRFIFFFPANVIKDDGLSEIMDAIIEKKIDLEVLGVESKLTTFQICHFKQTGCCITQTGANYISRAIKVGIPLVEINLSLFVFLSLFHHFYRLYSSFFLFVFQIVSQQIVLEMSE